MDVSFLRSNQELEFIKRGEVKASGIGQGNILNLKCLVLLLLRNQFQLVYLFTFKEVFHSKPVKNSSIRGNRKEVHFSFLLSPFDLIYWVGVFFGFRRWNINGVISRLLYIKNSNTSILESNRQNGIHFLVKIHT